MAHDLFPNFFLAGAPKAGTTTLYHELVQHPDVYMSPIKEPSYFAAEARLERMEPRYRAVLRRQEQEVRDGLEAGIEGYHTRGLVTQLEDYLRLFAQARGERAIGEASVCYLWSRTATSSILEVSPQARFLMILRNPVERAFSQYLHAVSDGHVSSTFREHICASLEHNGLMGPLHPFLEFGLYGEQLERMYRLVPRERVGVWLYEDTVRDRAAFLREVFRFLDVDPGFQPQSTKRHYRVEVPRSLGATRWLKRSGLWSVLRNATSQTTRERAKRLLYRKRSEVEMGAEERRFLVEYYRKDVTKLEQILGRDLAAWRQ